MSHKKNKIFRTLTYSYRLKHKFHLAHHVTITLCCDCRAAQRDTLDRSYVSCQDVTSQVNFGLSLCF